MTKTIRPACRCMPLLILRGIHAQIYDLTNQRTSNVQWFAFKEIAIGTEAAQFLFWSYLFIIFVVLSLQCIIQLVTIWLKSLQGCHICRLLLLTFAKFQKLRSNLKFYTLLLKHPFMLQGQSSKESDAIVSLKLKAFSLCFKFQV